MGAFVKTFKKPLNKLKCFAKFGLEWIFIKTTLNCFGLHIVLSESGIVLTFVDIIIEKDGHVGRLRIGRAHV